MGVRSDRPLEVHFIRLILLICARRSGDSVPDQTEITEGIVKYFLTSLQTSSVLNNYIIVERIYMIYMLIMGGNELWIDQILISDIGLILTQIAGLDTGENGSNLWTDLLICCCI